MRSNASDRVEQTHFIRLVHNGDIDRECERVWVALRRAYPNTISTHEEFPEQKLSEWRIPAVAPLREIINVVGSIPRTNFSFDLTETHDA